MGLMRLGRGERVRADMTSPARALTFPLLETIATTGIIWMIIGYLDNPYTAYVDPIVRNVLVAIWAILLVWRFVLPVLRARRKRFIVTNHRVIARAPGLRSKVDSIPLRQVHSARRYKGGISIAVFGHDRPVYFPAVPKAKKMEAMINESRAGMMRRPPLPR